MPDPILKTQDVLQSKPEPIKLGASPVFRINAYKNDGFGQPDQAASVNITNASCSIRNLDSDPDTEIQAPAVSLTAIDYGYTISFPVNTKTSPLNEVSRYIAILTYDFNTETQVDYIYFNVVGPRNIFGSSS